MKKKKLLLIILISVILLILLLCLLFIKNKKNHLSEDYKDIKISHVISSSVLIKNKSSIVLENNTKDTITIGSIRVLLYNYNDEVLLDKILEVGLLNPSSSKSFKIKTSRDLNTATKMVVQENNIFIARGSYNDSIIYINDFIETPSEYLFNLSNKSDDDIKNSKLTVDYLDKDKNVVLEKSFSFSLKSGQTTTIATKKGNIKTKKIEYIRVVNY